METEKCLACGEEVVFTNAVCPNCKTARSGLDEAAAQRHILKRKASAVATAARAQGASFGEIETELLKLGIGEELVKEIMMEVEGKTPQAMAEKNDWDMRRGLYWLVGGILVSVVTYLIARSLKNGGVYMIAWGAVVGGGIQFMRALLKSRGRS